MSVTTTTTISAYTVRYIDDRGDERVAAFLTSSAAWQFMRECDARGNAAGFPSLGAEPVDAGLLVG